MTVVPQQGEMRSFLQGDPEPASFSDPQDEDGQLKGVVVQTGKASVRGSTGSRGQARMKKHAGEADQSEPAGSRAGRSM